MSASTGVRLDKWLWAARFFKTRSIAKTAIEGGKVHVNGTRGKAAKELKIGDQVKLRQGWEEKTVAVIKLSDQRRGAPEAQLLYQETDESISKREALAAQRKAMNQQFNPGRPTKKQRRDIHRFKSDHDFQDAAE